MISHSRDIKLYCCEDISNIENFEVAEKSKELYDCHHKKEIELNVSAKDLKKMGLYWNRPANELIFIKHTEHASIHSKGRSWGKHTEEAKKKMSEKAKGRPSHQKGKTGELASMYGRRGQLHPMYGHKHSDSYKNMMSERMSGKNNPSYKKVCPLVLYTQYVILNKSLYTMSKELGVGRHALSKKIKEYGITRKEEH